MALINKQMHGSLKGNREPRNKTTKMSPPNVQNQFKRKRIVFLRKSAEIIRWTHAKRMNVETNYTFQIINSKQIIYLDYKMQAVKYLKKNIDKKSR